MVRYSNFQSFTDGMGGMSRMTTSDALARNHVWPKYATAKHRVIAYLGPSVLSSRTVDMARVLDTMDLPISEYEVSTTVVCPVFCFHLPHFQNREFPTPFIQSLWNMMNDSSHDRFVRWSEGELSLVLNSLFLTLLTLRRRRYRNSRTRCPHGQSVAQVLQVWQAL